MAVTPLLLAGLLVPAAYGFGPDTKLTYNVDVQFDGFLPLMGGNEGKVQVKMDVDVRGQAPADDRLKASSEIQAFSVEFNGAKLPIDVDNAKEYFPKTTITLDHTGKILSTDAPDRKLPVRLPGLDVKHFPDVTYVPIELPAGGVEDGATWTFTRDFGGAPISYECKADSHTDNLWKITVKLSQSYTVQESETFEVAATKEDAVSEVKTTMTGDGFVQFDAVAGHVVKAEMTNTAVSDVKKIATGETSQRKLVTKYTIGLPSKGPTNRSVQAARPPANLWEASVEWTTRAVSVGRNAMAWLQTASLFGLDALPRELRGWVQPFRSSLRRWAPWLGS